METKIIDGRAVAASVRERIRKDTEDFVKRTGTVPGLAVVLVGEDPASQVYVRNKHRACGEVGFLSRVYTLPESIGEDELLALIAELNADEAIHGILVQLPLPKHISESRVILAIDPRKDVDAFHPQNVGGIMTGDYKFVPCTPAGVMELLSYYGIDPSGKSAVVVGRSNIVGKPQALLLLEKNATVTVCHSRTKDLAAVTRTADILVVAVGRAKMITGDMVKEGAVVIDVGMNRTEDGKLCGDVDFESVFPVASHITPVPGGVGPMTITMLLCNTLRAAEDAAAKPCH
ncbi:MAG: bifunctional methylenetetrahydrofolate dehydrogenase/methenyltetrahydrofolate cyclohydrolase FolD [Clostridia bacterium]|nr:bifunctional methylenetetrahydrofolate dehydrogenase/methenyltetrahydrofolate cyclohydrolase FolD [Clostridia bacterium]